LNAEALRRLVRWAASGEPHPMYASTEQRNADIAAGATWPTDRLRALVHDGAAALDADLVALPADRWTAQIRTAQGRAVPASEIVWMRVREVAVHAVDLDTGTGFGDLPLPLCRALVADVAARRSGQGDGPALELTGTDGGSWTVTGAGAPVGVAGAAAELASWLTGRGAGGLSGVDGGPLPELGAWL
jgi:maleylpyruvate isomerase